MKKHFRILDLFYLRTPQLPLATILELKGDSPQTKEPNDLEAELQVVVDNLLSHLEDPFIREAIYLASPNLLESFATRYQASPNLEGLSSKKRKKVLRDKIKLEHALLRYLARMSYRCTPYGLFAGCTLGHFGPETKLSLADPSEFQRLNRLDMEVMAQIGQRLAEEPSIQAQIRFLPNSSLYPVPPHTWRYHEYRLHQDKRSYHLVSVDDSLYLRAVLNAAQSGARLEELAASVLALDEEIGQEEAYGFLQELIAEQVLVSELEPNVTGEDYLERLFKGVSAMQGVSEVAAWLKGLMSDLANLKPNDYAQNIGLYGSLRDSLSHRGITFQDNHLIQTDWFKPTAACHLSSHHQKDLEDLVDWITRWTFGEGHPRLAEFARRFYSRYEEAMVPTDRSPRSRNRAEL